MIGLGPSCCCGTGDCTVCLTVLCGGLAKAGVLVTLKNRDGATVGTCTTGTTGVCCFSGLFTSTYTYTTRKTGLPSKSGQIDVTCPGSAGVIVNIDTFEACFTVTGCGRLTKGATVTLTGGYTGTTDSAGRCCVTLPAAGTYNYTATKTHFTNATGSVTVASCNTSEVAVTLSPAAGYACDPQCCGGGNGGDQPPWPVAVGGPPAVLNFSFRNFVGQVTLLGPPVNRAWQYVGNFTGIENSIGPPGCVTLGPNLVLADILIDCAGSPDGSTMMWTASVTVDWQVTDTDPVNGEITDLAILSTRCPFPSGRLTADCASWSDAGINMADCPGVAVSMKLTGRILLGALGSAAETQRINAIAASIFSGTCTLSG